MKRTPLYEEHKKLGAKMVHFAGWEMPLSYTGVIEEHRTVRTAVGLFDISHTGRIEVTGHGVLELLQHVATTDVCQANSTKGYRQFSGTFGHQNEPYLLGSFHSVMSRSLQNALDMV